MFFIIGGAMGFVIVLAAMSLIGGSSEGPDYDYTDETGPLELPGISIHHHEELDELLVEIHAHQVARKTIMRLQVQDYTKEGLSVARSSTRDAALSRGMQRIVRNLTAEITILQREAVEKQKKYSPNKALRKDSGK